MRSRSVTAILALFLSMRLYPAPPDRIWQGGATTPIDGGCELEILSWNIERGQQLQAAASTIKQLAPAIALLQEVDVNAARTGRKNVAEELARQSGVNYIFAAEFEELGQGGRQSPAYHGQAILTALRASSPRFLRFRDQNDYWRPRWFVPNWAIFQRREGGRLALVAEVQTGSRRLVVYNVHLESRGTEDLRLRQMQEIIEDMQRYPGDTAILVAGDLNTRIASPPAVTALQKAGFRTAAGGEVTTTRGAALDWILVRGPVTFTGAKVHRDVRASDHFPLTLRIKLEPPACL
jgi:endonuclease/exonuclease/phosphatase family metal-dependent hydrolase